MSHNPIVKQINMGRAELASPVVLGQAGLLYQGQKFQRMLKPGESPDLGERIKGGMTIYVVDLATHEFLWQVALATNDRRDKLLFVIDMAYRISNPQKMIEERVSDTETRIMRALEPVIANVARDYTIHQYADAETKIQNAIQLVNLRDLCGLEFAGQPHVRVNMNDETQRRIKQLKDIDRAMRVAQSASHITEMPTKDPAYKFQVEVIVHYRVDSNKTDELPSDSLTEAEIQLWPRIKSAIRKYSRNFPVTEIAAADAAMQDSVNKLLDEGELSAFGLRVESVEVETDLDNLTRGRYAELAAIEHQNKLADLQRLGKKADADWYIDLIRQGNYAVLAVAVSRNEINATELYVRMSTAERERLEMQINLLNTLRRENMSDPDQDIRISKDLMGTIAGQVMQPTMTTTMPAPHVLPTEPEKPRLPEKTDTPSGDTPDVPAGSTA